MREAYDTKSGITAWQSFASSQSALRATMLPLLLAYRSSMTRLQRDRYYISSVASTIYSTACTAACPRTAEIFLGH